MLTNIYDVIVHPRMAMERITREKEWANAFGLQITIAVMNGIIILLGEEQLTGPDVLGAIFAIPVALAAWFVGSYILHLFARLFGLHGDWYRLTVGTAYLYLPQLIFLPLQVLFLLLGFDEAAVMMLALVFCAWSFALAVIAVQTVYQGSLVRSIITVLMPILLLIGTIVAIGLWAFFAKLAQ